VLAVSPGWWVSDPGDEHDDAERVGTLEDRARYIDDPIEKMALLAEAAELREKWDQPLHRFSSIAAIVEELQSIARDAREIDHTDSDALSDLGRRATDVGNELEDFSMGLDEAGAADEADET